ncbi:3-hydroxyphenylacetate 6-hydroxylase [Lachnellula cervina]|uniref:3-hydroxyphenylacetate 6-hydroxylase n=1 Tax=Lachnellula cervina TaxID=1316786 RepID=A0A7D8UV44_9HELO|nr:3-hydroxyphenylacetate 6-hydroxylase [Lachnellula cervina]
MNFDLVFGLLAWPFAAIGFVVAVYLVFNEWTRYQARLKGLKGPRGLPVIGNLYQVHNIPAAEKYRLWVKEYGDVYQIQLGNTPIVVINSAAAAKSLLLTQTSALNSRPMFHVFHKIITKSVLSIGTSPWDDSCKRRRKAAATALNRAKTADYLPILKLETTEFIRDLWRVGKSGTLAVDPTPITHRLSLNLSLTLNYGFRAESAKALETSPLLLEIMHIETEIGKLRSTGSNYSNYIPALRGWDSLVESLGSGKGNAYAKEIGRRRLEYNKVLLNSLKERIENGNDKPCIQGNVLKDPEASNLTEEELLSISLSMMAGAETTTPTIGWGILLLSQRPDLQKKAYQAIKDSGITEHDPFSPTEVPYLKAFTKEVLRYYTPLRLALPKATSGNAVWEGHVIPKNTMVFLNSWSCNRDPAVFENAFDFIPERWLEKETTGISHYSFGYGGRMCVASHVANKAVYLAFLHLVLTYEILPGEESLTDIDPIQGIKDVKHTRAAPKNSKVFFVPRNEKHLEEYLEE